MSEERSYLFGDGFGDYDGFMETCWMPEDDKDIDAIQYLLTTGQSFTGAEGRALLPPQNEPPPPPPAQEPQPLPKQVTLPPVTTALKSALPPPPTQPDVQTSPSTQLSPHPARTPAPHPESLNKVLEPVVPESEQVSPALPSNKVTKTKKGKKDKHKCLTAGCSQVFDTKTALSIHVGRIHKGDSKEKSYQCATCFKTFHNSSYLSQHMKIHSGDKPYVCSKVGCNKRFIQLSHKQQHERTHTGEKPYTCKHPGCEKSFSQLSNLQSHTRSHLPDGLVKCSSCYKCFKTEQALEKHTKIAHLAPSRQRAHQCPICTKSYTQDTYLRSHMVKKHGREAADGALKTDQDISVQAFGDMCADIRDPRMEEAEASIGDKLSSSQTMALAHGFTDSYNPYMRPYQPPSVQPQFPAPNTGRREFNGQGSAFKPLNPRGASGSGGLDSIETLAMQSRQQSSMPAQQQQSISTASSSVFPQAKNPSTDAAEKEMFYNNFKWNYPPFNYMQTYNNSTFTNFMNTPLESYTDKAGNIYPFADKTPHPHSLYASEVMTDFILSGLRESYGNE